MKTHRISIQKMGYEPIDVYYTDDPRLLDEVGKAYQDLIDELKIPADILFEKAVVEWSVEGRNYNINRYEENR